MIVDTSWKEVNLEDHVDLVVGYAFKSSGYTDDESDVRLLRGDNVAQGELRWDKAKRWPVADYQRYEAFHLREGDIILAMDRPWISAGLKYARVRRKDTPSLLVQRVARLRGTESLKTDYLRCVIGSADFTDYVLSILTGVNIPHISAKDIKRFRFLLPPVAIQERISRVITSYDDLIENNTRRIEILEEMARRLYEEWFVQFRFPGHEGAGFKESLPSGWAWVTIEDAADNFDRQRRPLSKMQRAGRSGSYPYYGAAKVFDYIDDYLFEGRYLLMAEDGSVITPDGHPVLQLTHGRFWVNNHAHILKGCAPFSTELIYLALSAYQIAGHITGAAQPKITQANMNRIPILRATNDVHVSFNALIGPIFDLKVTLERKNANLRAQRDLLLPKLISGEIDVSDIPMPT